MSVTVSCTSESVQDERFEETALADEDADQAEAEAPPDVTALKKTAARGPVRVRDDAERARMEEYLRTKLEPGAIVETHVSTAGQTVDCVDVLRQPALQRPEMAGVPIETPPADPDDEDLDSLDLASIGDEGRCPDGSIPIVRRTMKTLERFTTLEDFHRKYPGQRGGTSEIEPPADGPTNLHQYATARQYVSNRGGEAFFNVWHPYVQEDNEFSLSQIWVATGSGDTVETVEAGWQKYPGFYDDDTNSHFFIYFTSDNYQTTGCYNLECPAFVQVSNAITIGGAIDYGSTDGGTQREIKILWFKDGDNGAWWLRVNGTWIGYYPKDLYDDGDDDGDDGMLTGGSRVTFGGEIIDRQVGGDHTATDMGSGDFPGAGYRYAAYDRLMRYVDRSNYYRAFQPGAPSPTDPNCYDASVGLAASPWGRYMFFGGEGYNPMCQ